MKLSFYQPVEIVFHLLCILRKSEVKSAQAVHAAMRKRGLRSLEKSPVEARRLAARINFFIRLCQAASLLDEAFTPTLLMEDWLNWSLEEQIRHLVGAWLIMPESTKVQRRREDLLRRVSLGEEVSSSQQAALAGLRTLGICDGVQLTRLGHHVLRPAGRPKKLVVSSPEPWQVVDGQITIPFPPDWKLAWELEKYLDPRAAWVYPLNEKTLRLAVQRGALLDVPSLPQLVALGSGRTLPAAMLHMLEEAPAIRLVHGFVLEFSHPGELKELRRKAGMRRYLDHLLSPRHVVLDPWQGYAVLKRLFRRGLLSEQDLANTCPPDYPVGNSAGNLAKSERVYLLSTLLIVEALQTGIAPPPGLLGKLAGGLDHPLRASAARKAALALAQIRPRPDWKKEEAPPPFPAGALIQALQMAIDRGEAVDILYQASARHTPEPRHITPLLLEQRGARFYLIAYCHMRRANRTFRLDRLTWLDGEK